VPRIPNVEVSQRVSQRTRKFCRNGAIMPVVIGFVQYHRKRGIWFCRPLRNGRSDAVVQREEPEVRAAV
jgi:hypothetical protein